MPQRRFSGLRLAVAAVIVFGYVAWLSPLLLAFLLLAGMIRLLLLYRIMMRFDTRARAELAEKMGDAKKQLAAVREMRTDEMKAQAAAAREQVQAKLEELQRRFDERASQLSRTRKSMLRGNPTARSARYDAVLQKLKKRLQDGDRTD